MKTVKVTSKMVKVNDRQCTYNVTQARLGNHCCNGKAKGSTHSECVCLVTGIHHAMRMRHTVICGLSGSKIFLNIIS